MKYKEKTIGKGKKGKDGQAYLYDHGLPFSTVLDENIDAQKERIDLNKASMIIIDGGQGEGKTTLAVHIADYYQGKPINLADQIALGGDDFQKKLRLAIDKKYKVLIYDEAGDFASRNAMSGFNRMMNRVFETFRTYQILIILCLPSFSVLDTSLFYKQIPRFLIHCHGRTRKYGNYSGYELRRMMWIKHNMLKLVVPSDAFRREKQNFRGHFLPLPPTRQKRLDVISTEAKLKTLDNNLATMNGWFTTGDMAKKTGYSHSKIRYMIKEKGLKPVHRNSGGRNMFYYDGSVVKAIVEDLS